VRRHITATTVPNQPEASVEQVSFWSKPLAAVLEDVGTSGDGLSSSEAESRLRRDGPNELTRVGRWAATWRTIRHLVNPLVLILLAASAASALLGDSIDALIILLIVLFSTAIDLLQIRRSQAAADQLRRRIELQTSAKRDGDWAEVPSRLVVRGDRIRLSTGDIVPADARVVDSNSLYLDEAAFTGESLPVAKLPSDSLDGTAASAATNAVFMGTVVTGGSGEAVVARTGRETTYSQLAERLQKVDSETAFDRGLRDFSLLISRTVLVLVLFVALVNIAARHNPFQSLLFAVALAVGLTPEFLPMILTICQAEGALQMARSKVIVRRLNALENFGGLDILCSDKTGTLTEGRMQVSSATDATGAVSERTSEYAFINASVQSGLRSPFDDALSASPPPNMPQYQKVGELPYDFNRRRLSVIVDMEGQRLVITKGAPESVLEVCSAIAGPGDASPLNADARAAINHQMEDLGEAGFRVLGVASRVLTSGGASSPEIESGLTFDGLVAFSDPPRPDVAAVVQSLRADSIQLKILTGDADSVTRHVCQSIGLVDKKIMTGDELDRLSDQELAPIIDQVDVFARVAPEQKLRIIQALQRQRRVVGYLGDGINDAPSLRAADVGISVSGAVDVAREAADVILVEKSLQVLHNGILEGRKSFGNVIKYIMMGTSSNFGNMLSMAGASVFLPFLPMLPTQVLLNNALYDLSQIAIPTDRVDPALMQKPHQWDIHFIRDFMVIFGPISSVYDFLTFFILLRVFHAGAELFHTGWFVESLATQTFVVFVIRTVGSPLKCRPSAALVGAVLAVVAIATVLPFTGLASVLGFTPLPLTFLVFVVFAVVTYLGLVEFVKRMFYRYHSLTR
jgi:P-type Mg2+ transporter